jgi:hypothetical protein
MALLWYLCSGPVDMLDGEYVGGARCARSESFSEESDFRFSQLGA